MQLWVSESDYRTICDISRDSGEGPGPQSGASCEAAFEDTPAIRNLSNSPASEDVARSAYASRPPGGDTKESVSAGRVVFR